MRTNIRSQTRFMLVMSLLGSFIEKWWVKYIVGPFITAAPPGVVFAYLSYDKLSPSLKEWLPGPIFNGVHQHPLAAFIGALGYVYALTAMYGFIDSARASKDDQIDAEALVTLSEVLEKVVGSKANRFGLYVKENISSPGGTTIPASEVFNGITEPVEQIILLVQAVHSFFEAIGPNDISFHVSLVKVDDGIPVDWMIFWPQSEPPKIPIEDLQSPNSGICRAIKKRGLIIIEDIKRAASDGEYVGNNVDDDGSILCYPLIHSHSGTTPYVLSISADKKGYFKKHRRPIYKWLLKHFEVRIGLEHSLLLLKNCSQGGDELGKDKTSE